MRTPRRVCPLTGSVLATRHAGSPLNLGRMVKAALVYPVVLSPVWARNQWISGMDSTQTGGCR